MIKKCNNLSCEHNHDGGCSIGFPLVMQEVMLKKGVACIPICREYADSND